MSKLLSLTILLLGLYAFTTEARRCRPRPSKSCSISYYDIAAAPSCETSIENGEEMEMCSAVGSAAYAAQLDARYASFSENWGLSEVAFSGDCNCELQLWSGPEQSGDTFIYKFSKKNNDFLTSDIWSEENQSFEIRCKF